MHAYCIVLMRYNTSSVIICDHLDQMKQYVGILNEDFAIIIDLKGIDYIYDK